MRFRGGGAALAAAAQQDHGVEFAVLSGEAVPLARLLSVAGLLREADAAHQAHAAAGVGESAAGGFGDEAQDAGVGPPVVMVVAVEFDGHGVELLRRRVGAGEELLGAGDQGVIALGGAEVLGRAGQPAGVVGREQAGADEQEEQQEEAQAAGTAGGGGGLGLKHGGRATERGCAAMIDRSERTAGSLAFSETTQSPRRRQVPIPRPVSAGGGRRDGRRGAPCGYGG